MAMIYNECKEHLMKPKHFSSVPLDLPLDFSGDDVATTGRLYVALFKDTYPPSASHEFFPPLVWGLYECAGPGYTAYGLPIGDPTVDLDDDNAFVDGDDITFTNVTLTGNNAPRYAVLYYRRNAGSEILGTLVAVYDFGAPVPVDNADFTIEWHIAGLMRYYHQVTTPGTFVFNNAKIGLLTGRYNLDEGEERIVAALTTASYIPLPAHEDYTDIDNEVVGAGYTAGGEDFASTGVVVSGNSAALTGTPTSWTSATFTARRVVLYNADVGDELISVMTFGENKVVAGGLFRILWSAPPLSIGGV